MRRFGFLTTIVISVLVCFASREALPQPPIHALIGAAAMAARPDGPFQEPATTSRSAIPAAIDTHHFPFGEYLTINLRSKPIRVSLPDVGTEKRYVLDYSHSDSYKFDFTPDKKKGWRLTRNDVRLGTAEVPIKDVKEVSPEVYLVSLTGSKRTYELKRDEKKNLLVTEINYNDRESLEVLGGFRLKDEMKFQRVECTCQYRKGGYAGGSNLELCWMSGEKKPNMEFACREVCSGDRNRECTASNWRALGEIISESILHPDGSLRFCPETHYAIEGVR